MGDKPYIALIRRRAEARNISAVESRQDVTAASVLPDPVEYRKKFPVTLPVDFLKLYGTIVCLAESLA